MDPHAKLLVVDDEQAITHHLQLLFEGDSYLTYSAESADEALTIIDHNDIDILITDINMPGMNGLELVSRVKMLKPNIQCMVLTGYGDMKNAREAIKAGAVDFISKPLHFEEMKTAVSEGMERRQLQLELQKRQQELEKSNQQLRQARHEAEKANVAKTAFLANMSHEIRTPLNGVLGMAELLFESGLTNKQRKYCEMLQTSGMNLFTLINNILDISKIEAGKLELELTEFNLRDLVKDVMTQVSSIKRRKNITFQTTIHPNTADFLIGDPLRLQQILLNLLSNAVKFSKEGQILTSIQALQEDEAKILLQCSVQDPGIGIAPDVIEHIFDPFIQADKSVTRRFGGTGLGLNIIQHLIAMMNGDISVESIPGQGSTFSFTVSLTKATSKKDTVECRQSLCQIQHKGQKQQERQQKENQLTFPGKRILLVEDNYINQQVSLELLHLLKCQVDLAENGKEALLFIQTQQPYDLVFMDCHMPVMDGYTATKLIREHEKTSSANHHVPIIAITARAIQGDCEECLGAGMDDYMSKPFTKSKLISKLSAWIQGEDVTSSTQTRQTVPMSSHKCLDLDTFMDIKTLNILRSREQAGRPIFQRLITYFLGEAPRVFTVLKTSIRTKDDEKLFFDSHRFKSSCLSLGLTTMVHFCSELENAGKKNDLKQAKISLDNLQQEYTKIIPHLLQEQKTLQTLV